MLHQRVFNVYKRPRQIFLINEQALEPARQWTDQRLVPGMGLGYYQQVLGESLAGFASSDFEAPISILSVAQRTDGPDRAWWQRLYS